MSLIQKVNQKLASQPVEDILRQQIDAELGELALNCVKNASIAEDLMGALHTPAGASVASGLGGAAIGGLGTALTASKRNDETEDEFRSRRMSDSAMGAVAGGAVGAAAPVAGSYFKTLSDSLDGNKASTGEKIIGTALNPQTLSTVGGGAAALGADSYLNNRNLKFLSELKIDPKTHPDAAKVVAERLASATQAKVGPITKGGVAKKIILAALGGGVGYGAFKGIASQPAFNAPILE